MDWTGAQHEAIYARDCNLLVSAGAGSGKTAVLVERIIRVLSEDGVNLDRLLVVTFTQAAAGEMRERVSKALLEKLALANGREDHFRRQLYLLKSASISTIHAFCTDLLRSYFHVINLDPRFRVADENTARIIRNEALEELLETEYGILHPCFTDLVEMFSSSHSDEALGELILRTHSFVHSLPRPWEWLDKQAEVFGLDSTEFLQSDWMNAWMSQLKDRLHGIQRLLQQARQLAYKEPSLDKYLLTLELDMDNLERLKAALGQGAGALAAELTSVKIPRLGRAGKDADPLIKDLVKDLRDEARQHLADIIKGPGGLSLADQHLDLERLQPGIDYLKYLVKSFDCLYAARKRDRNLLDFNDLEHKALELLRHSYVAAEVREKYLHIFVDEYQDSNLVQEEIIQSIRRDDNLFLVGDIKQSIYRFRLADPTLFLNKYAQYVSSRDEERSRCIDLVDNYRSEKAILDAVNFLFNNIMSKALGEMDYGPREYLQSGWDLTADAPAISPVMLTILDQTGQEDSDLADMESAEIEARVAAAYIQQLLGQEVFDQRTGSLHRLQYNDMVILLRATRQWGTVFWQVFSEQGIPVYADVNTGYFEALEVQILVNLLRLIDNKRQDIPLLSVMRSPLGLFTIEEMVEIRSATPGAAFHEALACYARTIDSELARKADLFWVCIDQWQDKANYMPLDDLIWEIILDSGYYYYLGALPGGGQRQANLRLLIDQARQFQQTSYTGIYQFLAYLEKLEQSSGDMGMACVLGENENLVRIMSIHKSKGLEFPVVIIPGLGKRFNLRDTAAPLLLHRQLGIGPRLVDLSLRSYRETLAHRVIKTQIRQENLAEEMRILYVAMTRARNRLILLGSLPRLERSVLRWLRPLDSFILSNSSNYLDWIGPVLMRHHDGHKLRHLLPGEYLLDELLEDSSGWDISHLEPGPISLLCRKEPLIEEKTSPLQGEGIGEEVKETVRSRLEWNYPHPEAPRIPTKIAASQLVKLNRNSAAGMACELPIFTKTPLFLQEEDGHGNRISASASEIGTLTHFIMQHLNLHRVGTQEEILDQMQGMAAREVIYQEALDLVNVNQISAFFASELGRRIQAAKQVFRELPFNLVQTASQVFGDCHSSPEQLLIQGVVDLCFLEGEELVLVDYKTDRVFTEDGLRDLAARYKPQLELYRQALESLLKRKVKESYLYMFALNRALRI